MEMLIIITVFLSSVFILAGGLLKKYPQYMSGYDRENPPSKELLSEISIAFVLAGFTTLFGVIVSYVVFDSDALVGAFLIVPMLVASIYVVCRLRQKLWRLVVVILLVFLVGCLSFGAYSIPEPEVEVEEGVISVSGLYGEDIPLEKIRAVCLLETMPKIETRLNGFSLVNIKKGHFRLRNEKNATLFLRANKQPFLRIDLIDNRTIFINFENPTKTITLYDRLLYVGK